MYNYICYNGRLLSKDKAMQSPLNRAFMYGDSLFETIHAYASNIQYLDDHYDRLTRGMKCLQMEIPSSFTIKNLHEQISNLIIKNNLFKGVRIRLTVWRNIGGLYTPSDNSVSYMINCTELSSGDYSFNKKGYIIDIYNEICKHNNILSPYKTGNSLIYIMGALYRKKKRLNDCLLCNETGNIVEALSSNVFIVKDNVLITPSLDSGPVCGVMRKQIISIAQSLNLEVKEIKITINDLLAADEIFLTNAISGIRWVVGFQNRRYFKKISKIISDELNNQNNF